MRWLRIAIGLTVSLLTTLLCLLPVHAAQGSNWSVLSDPQGDLQLSDIRSARMSSQFSPIELSRLQAAQPNEALWLRFQLVPDKHEQVLRVFAPDLSRLDLYVLDDQKLISEVSTGNALPHTEKPFPSSDYLLPLPQSKHTLDVYLRLVSDHQLRPHITLDTAVMSAANQGKPLLYGLLLGCLAMLVLHNLSRFVYTRTISCLWLAICEILLLTSSALFLNLLGPWFPGWHGTQAPGAYLARAMLPVDPTLLTARDQGGPVYWLAEDEDSGVVIGSVMGLNHHTAFNDPENGLSEASGRREA